MLSGCHLLSTLTGAGRAVRARDRHRRTEVFIGELIDGDAALQKILLRLRPENPRSITTPADIAQSYGEVGTAVQGVEEPVSEDSLGDTA